VFVLTFFAWSRVFFCCLGSFSHAAGLCSTLVGTMRVALPQGVPGQPSRSAALRAVASSYPSHGEPSFAADRFFLSVRPGCCPIVVARCDICQSVALCVGLCVGVAELAFLSFFPVRFRETKFFFLFFFGSLGSVSSRS